MDKKICTYIYAYKNKSLSYFAKPLIPYLMNVDLGLGDIHYYMTLTNKDKTIDKSDLDKLLNELNRFDELILIKSIYPPKNELDFIIEICKKNKCNIITISKNGELLGVINHE